MSPLQGAKLYLIELLGLSKDALHIYVALAVFLGSAALFRWPLRSWKPWLLVLAAALAGEAWDIRDTMVTGLPVLPGDNRHDIINTMFWPTLLFGLARWTRVLQRR